ADRAFDHDVRADLRGRGDLGHRADDRGRVDRQLLAVLRAAVVRRLGRNGLPRDPIPLVRPRGEVDDAAALGAERAMRVPLPVDLAAAGGAADATHDDTLPGTADVVKRVARRP